MKHVRVKVCISMIHGNGKETVEQQIWRDVPLSKVDDVKFNAPGACVDAMASLLGEPPQADGGE